jgi:hypothetical protein
MNWPNGCSSVGYVTQVSGCRGRPARGPPAWFRRDGLAWPARAQAVAQDSSLPGFLRDRGTGVPASLFGTYVRRGQLLVYPFFEYAKDNNREYQPKELGFGPDIDFRSRYRSYAGQIFLGYGVTDWLAIELEGSVINARLEKSPLDTFGTPPVIEETGVGDIEGQVRARLLGESNHRPEFFGFVEVTPATRKHKRLIAEPDFDLKPGVGLVKGFSWGTLTGRIGAEYNREESRGWTTLWASRPRPLTGPRRSD